MKPKNFPARKALRKLNAKRSQQITQADMDAVDAARNIRTKKRRAG